MINLLKKKDITINSEEAHVISITGNLITSDKEYSELRKIIWEKIKFEAYNRGTHIIKEIPYGIEKDHIDSLIEELKSHRFICSITELDKTTKIIFIKW